MIWYEMHPAVLRIRELTAEADRERLAASARRGRSGVRRRWVARKTLDAALLLALRSTRHLAAGRTPPAHEPR